MPILSPLTQDEQNHFLIVALDDDALRALVGRLGTAGKGVRIDTLSAWEMADSLSYHYGEPDVAEGVDRALERSLGASPLAPAVATGGGGAALAELLLESRDPARDLAWALLTAGGEDAGALAQSLVQTIIADFDEADRRAEEEGAAPRRTLSPDAQAKQAVRQAAKEAQKALAVRERAEQRVEQLKERLVDLDARLATARQELRDANKDRRTLTAERDRLQRERDTLRARLQAGTAGAVERLQAELDDAARRERALAAQRDDAHATQSALADKLRALEQAPVAAAVAEPDEPAAAPASWSLPIYSAEFYTSLRRWDRRILRATFDKIHRLCEDWRHPSLRAIPLEGLPDCFRIRIATDVRLIYRPLDGGRIEILSLIDREDLQRYVRHAKT